MKTTVAAVLVALVLFTACGDPATDPGGSPGNAGPDSPVAGTPDPDASAKGPAYELVEPRPGMADVRPRPFIQARPKGDGGTLLVTFWSGVEPCSVLDHVDVDETDESVTITLHEGHDPEAEDVACIEIALKKAVEVTLAAPLGDRKVIDGAK